MSTPALRPLPVILIVEDSDEDFDTVSGAVGKAGLLAEICRVATGGDALLLLRAQFACRPILVLMDLNTHGTDGREALQEIKADPALKAVPVVVMSTSANARDLEFCYRAGANAYHVKPVRYAEHQQAVMDLLK